LAESEAQDIMVNGHVTCQEERWL